MKITVFSNTHNHPVNKEIASFYPENCRIELDENDTNNLKRGSTVLALNE